MEGSKNYYIVYIVQRAQKIAHCGTPFVRVDLFGGALDNAENHSEVRWNAARCLGGALSRSSTSTLRILFAMRRKDETRYRIECIGVCGCL